MIIFKLKDAISKYLFSAREKGKKTGFVPTMGALHAGHISLVEEAKSSCDLVVSSIFVNPTQFNDPADFEKYPVTVEQDIDQLEKAGCDLLFLPAVPEMYPEGLAEKRHYELGYLETILEGAYRPGHFQGVCLVVEKLLRIVQPDLLFLGQKDYQQCMVLQLLVEQMGSATHTRICSTKRESDGLAMSSRNKRIDSNNRPKAAEIYQALLFIRQHIQPGNQDALVKQATERLTAAGFRVDYISIAAADTLLPVDNWNGNTPLVALAAAFLGEVRLIDNLVL